MKQLDRAVGGVVITVQDEVGTRVAKFLVVFNPVGRDCNLAHFRQRLEEGVAAVMMRNASVRSGIAEMIQFALRIGKLNSPPTAARRY